MKYSIVLPVRNGGSYVKECVQSILSQTLKDFELVVLDNNSTDGTTDWLRSLNDDRIILYLSENDLTIEENWARVLTVPKSQFCTLIGHDDLLEPHYLEVMDRLISKYPDASLFLTQFHLIDSKGAIIRKAKEVPERQSGPQFLQSLLQNKFDLMGTGFMMRSKDYEAVKGIPPYPSLLFADFELLVELAGIGYLVADDQVCFSFRIHQSTTTRSSNITMQKAFDRLMHYLEKLRRKDRQMDQVIQGFGLEFLSVYCKGLTHRLLRTPVSKRDGLMVRDFLIQCRHYASILSPDKKFDPLSIPSVRLAAWIDASSISRKAFLMFKKIYSKPVLK
jgi:glycosyltransferase involved in cell wall biosynthesis